MNLLKQNILVTLVFVVVLFSNSVTAEILFTHEGDSIAYDESNNHFIITYVGLRGEINEVIWHPPSDINIVVDAEYKTLKNGNIKYKYKFAVSKSSKLNFDSLFVYVLALDKTSAKSPEQWRVLTRNTYDPNDPEQRIGWYTTKMAVQPGSEIKGFEYESIALPVYGTVYASGETEILAYVDHGPNAEAQAYFYGQVIDKHANGKAVNTAVPLIPVSDPFNLSETYTSFHKYLLKYIEKGFIDTSITTDLMDASTAVLNALRAKDVNHALLNFKTVKKLVEGETGKPHPISLKELRKILNFNLMFINKKLEGSF